MTNPQIQNDPVYSLPFLYISGLTISAASTTVLAIAPGQARDSSDNIDMAVGFPNLQGNVLPNPAATLAHLPLFVSSLTNGANGLDTGAIAASTNYSVWLIGDSRGYKPVAGLLSLYSNAFPLLPVGYDSYRLLGFANTDGSKHFLAAQIVQAANAQGFFLQPEASVLSGGNATSFTGIDLSATIPDAQVALPDTSVVILDVTFTPAAIGDVVQFRPYGSTATANLPTIVGIAAGIPQQQYIQVVCGTGFADAGDASISYLVTSSSDSVNVSITGWYANQVITWA
jgi:hypothetical protein